MPNYNESIHGDRYNLNSDYSKHCQHKTLNDFLYKEFSLKNIYDFEVKQSQINSNNNVFIIAKMKKDFFDKICLQFS